MYLCECVYADAVARLLLLCFLLVLLLLCLLLLFIGDFECIKETAANVA